METPTLFRSYIDTPLPELLSDPWIHINGDEGADPTAPMISIYTDGSKLDNQKDKSWGTGAGFAIFLGLDDVSVTDHPSVA